jgi:hypothetical protein
VHNAAAELWVLLSCRGQLAVVEFAVENAYIEYHITARL